MVYIALLYIKKLPSVFPSVFDFAANERIEKTENENLRVSRTLSYALLERSYRDIFGDSVPKLSFCIDGKPELIDSDMKISISHTTGLCAVAFSQNDVGVDVQSCAEMFGKERVLKRYVNESLQNIIKKAKSPEVSYRFYKLNDEGEFVKCEKLEEGGVAGDNSDAFVSASLWSAFEAVLKCGRGFSELPQVTRLAERANIATLRLGGAALSVAEIVV